MSLSSLLRRILGVRRGDDPVFGPLRRMGRKAKLWEGRVPFAPLDVDVDVLVEADQHGPTASQRAILRELEARYDEIHAECLARVADGAPFRSDMDLVVIDIPPNAQRNGRCELTFEGPDRLVSVVVEGWHVTTIE